MQSYKWRSLGQRPLNALIVLSMTMYKSTAQKRSASLVLLSTKCLMCVHFESIISPVMSTILQVQYQGVPLS